MIPGPIVYCRPESLSEAFSAWSEWSLREGGSEGLRWLGGGTEIMTGARKAARLPRVLLDLKSIPEARGLGREGGRLSFGAALPLSEAGDSGLFPLLSAVIRRLADRTTRNRLSLGGNAAGALPYREALLPLLLAGARVRSAVPAGGPEGFAYREAPLAERLGRRLLLEPGELLLSFSLPAEAAELPFRAYRATRSGPVDYPLACAAFLRGEGGIACAVTGLHPHPVLYPSTEAARSALADPAALREDHRAGAAYRSALALGMIARAEEELA